MAFKIRVKGAIFEWRDDSLHCTNESVMNALKQGLQLHIPKVVVPPDLIDFDDDLKDGRNAFYAILGVFADSEIIEEPSEGFLDYDNFDDEIVY